MAVTNFPTNTEITNLQSTTYDVAGGQVTQASKQNGFITGVKQLITFLKSDSPQFVQEAETILSPNPTWLGEVRFYKTSDGRVQIRMYVYLASVSSSAPGTDLVAMLPVNYRPAEYQIFAAVAEQNNNFVCGRVDIITSGEIKIRHITQTMPTGQYYTFTGSFKV